MIFLVYHVYDVDGGFGDAISKKDLVAAFKTEDLAKQFVEKYSNDEVYEIPYDELHSGLLVYEPLEVFESLDNVTFINKIK